MISQFDDNILYFYLFIHFENHVGTVCQNQTLKTPTLSIIYSKNHYQNNNLKNTIHYTNQLSLELPKLNGLITFQFRWLPGVHLHQEIMVGSHSSAMPRICRDFQVTLVENMTTNSVPYPQETTSQRTYPRYHSIRPSQTLRIGASTPFSQRIYFIVIVGPDCNGTKRRQKVNQV